MPKVGGGSPASKKGPGKQVSKMAAKAQRYPTMPTKPRGTGGTVVPRGGGRKS